MKVLVVAPHPDDEVLGVGGSIARHNNVEDEVYLCIVTKAYTPDWSEQFIENRRFEVRRVSEILGIKETRFLDYPTAKLDTVPRKQLNDSLTACIKEMRPDLVYAPHPGDVNLDHRIVFEATVVATRPTSNPLRKLVTYETPSETDLAPPFSPTAFIPNIYVDIKQTLETKIKALAIYKTEIKEFPHPRSVRLLSSLACKRGAEAGLEAAEGFMLMREIIR